MSQKINNLLQKIPRKAVLTNEWLKAQSVSPELKHHYIQSKWFTALGSGACVRTGEEPAWEGGVHALQYQLNKHIHVGGRTALEKMGRGHYVRFREVNVYLFSPTHESLPKWFTHAHWGPKLHIKHYNILPPELGIIEQDFDLEYPLKVSAPERAILEMACYVPHLFGFDETGYIMENLIGLRVEIVQALLEQCTSVKGKRIFLFLAQEAQCPWLKNLTFSKINLGNGKRQVIKEGKYEPEYQITIPRHFGYENQVAVF